MFSLGKDRFAVSMKEARTLAAWAMWISTVRNGFRRALRGYVAGLLIARLMSGATVKITVAIALLMSGSLPIRAQNEVLTEKQLTQVFDEAIHILGGNANVMSRWVDTVRFASIGDVGSDVHAVAADTFRAVAAETQLNLLQIRHDINSSQAYLAAVKASPPFDMAVCASSDADQCANFVVVFASSELMRELAEALPLRKLYVRAFDSKSEGAADVACFFSPFIDGRMEIRQAFVYVNEDLSRPMLKTCLQEEIYQSFGLFNDYSESEYFSFNNVVAPKEITHYDRALLRSVYDDSRRPGAPAFVIVKDLMTRLGYPSFER